MSAIHQMLLGSKGVEPLSIVSATVEVNAVITGHDLHLELWTDSGGSPVAQIGVDSNATTVSSTGTKVITWTDPQDISAYSAIWLIYQTSGGDCTYKYNTSVSGTPGSVTGGDFEGAGGVITNLVSSTSFVPNMIVTFNDDSTRGEGSGNAAAGLNGSGSNCMGLLLDLT